MPFQSESPPPDFSQNTKTQDPRHTGALPVLVINLDRSTERLRNIAKRLDALGVRWERCPAIDGMDFHTSFVPKNYSPTLNLRRYHKPLSFGEIACYLSFRKAWRTILDKGWEAAVVLEDDALLRDTFPESLSILSENKDKWDAVKLASGKSVTLLSQTKLPAAHLQNAADGWTLGSPLKIPNLNPAQAFSARAARLLLSSTAEFGAPVDVELRHHWRTGVYFQVLLPFPANPNNEETSDIESTQSRKFKELKRRPFSKFKRNFLFSLNSYRYRPKFEETARESSAAASHYLRDGIPIFVINLPAALERREFMQKQLDALGLKYRFQCACLGKTLTPEELSSVYDEEKRKAGLFARPLTLPEIGCAASHHAVYKRITEENLPFALILEDDASLEQRLPIALQELALRTNPDEAKIVLLTKIGTHSRYGNEHLGEKHELVKPYSGRRWVNAHGYFITNRGARVLAEHFFPIHYLADAWTFFAKLSGIKILALVPFCIDHSRLSAISQIGTTKRTRNAAREVFNFLWRHCFHRLFIFPFFAKNAKRRPFHPIIINESLKLSETRRNGSRKMRIAVVGNSVPQKNYGPEIDGADIVIRFNSCPNAKTNWVGVKTDVLALMSCEKWAVRKMLKKLNANIPLDGVSEIWLPRIVESDSVAKLPGTFEEGEDATALILENKKLTKKCFVALGDENYRRSCEEIKSRHDANSQFVPSTGFLVFMFLQCANLPANVELTFYCFTFQGWDKHAWAAEKEIILSKYEVKN